MTLQQLLYFREVVETQHFTQAAQNLYVSQSALSYSIQSLEREIGVPLFIRRKSDKNVKLTVYGKAFLPYCRQAIEALEAGRDELNRMRNPQSGVVSIIYSYINCHKLIPDIFNQFYDENDYGDISVQFAVNHEKTKVESEVIYGNADLGFACTVSYDGLEMVPIAWQELVLMLPAKHPLAKKKVLTLEDIKDEMMISYYPDSNLYAWISEMYRQSGLKLNPAENFNDWSSRMTHVALNLGVAISPMIPVDPHLIAVRKLDHPMNKRKIYMFWPVERDLSPAAEYVKDYCIEWSLKKYGKSLMG